MLLITSTCHAQTTPPTFPTPPSTAQRPTPEALAATAAAASADPTILNATEPPNFAIARYRLADYYDCTGTSGCYWADLEAQTRRAEVELDRLYAAHHAANAQEKLAIVLDIDETSLTSYCEEKHEDFGYISSMFETWIVSPEASIPIPGTLRLFNHARSLGIEVFFLTGRAHTQYDSTARNLATAGYKGWKGLILRDESELHTATTEYKAAERAKIVAQGFTLLLNMGDQWSDLNGTPRAEISVKLPNPFYYLP